MDPVALITAALAAGAAAGTTDTVAAAVRDGYAGLRALICRRLAGNPEAQEALDGYVTEPGRWQEELAKVLAEAGIAHDHEAVNLSQQLMGQLDPAGSRHGKYAVDLRDAKGVQIGDGSVQFNQFS
jgi:hypothetical protein